MNIVQKSRAVGLSIGLIAAFALLIPISVSAATLYAADSYSGEIYKFASDGSRTTFANRQATLNAGIGGPIALALDASGNLFVADHGSNIRKFTSDGVATSFAINGGNPTSLVVDASGNIFESDFGFASGSGFINKFTSNGVRTTFATGLSIPYSLAVDANGNLFESDFNSGTINKFTPTGVKTAFATGLHPSGLAFAPVASTSTAVPEPFTIIGTLIGGTAALRMRKKLKSSGKV